MPNPNTATQESLDVPNSDTSIEITRDILPVHCPLDSASLWDSHPRYIFLSKKPALPNDLIVVMNTFC